MLNLECTKLVEVVIGQSVVDSVVQVIEAQFNSGHAKAVIDNLADVSAGVVQSVFKTELYTQKNGEIVYSENRYVFVMAIVSGFHKIEMYRK